MTLALNRRSAAKDLVTYFVFLAVGLWLALDPPELVILRDNTTILRVVGLAGAILFGLVAINSTFVILRPSSGLTINSDGIIENYRSVRSRFYPWSSISQVSADREHVQVTLRANDHRIAFKPSLFKGFEDEPECVEDIARRIAELRPRDPE